MKRREVVIPSRKDEGQAGGGPSKDTGQAKSHRERKLQGESREEKKVEQRKHDSAFGRHMGVPEESSRRG